MYKIGEEIEIVVNRAENPDFDRACEAAWKHAIMEFGIDEDGHSSRVEGYERSTCSIIVESVTYRHQGGMGGHSFTYRFKAWVEQAEDL